ncbi:MAG: sigma-54 dependent transcriptional regulator, partial [Mariprofundaceae bacterium]
MADVLLVEDEANARKILSMGLELQGHQVVSCPGPGDAGVALKKQHFDVVLTDLRMDGRDAGLEVIKTSRSLQPDTPVLLLTAYASAETAVAAMKEGAFDYLTKPVSTEELADAVERALLGSTPKPVVHKGNKPVEDGATILIGETESMQRVRERLGRAAKSEFTVLISGESGTGKELAARYVHEHSSRKHGAFVPVHCGAIPEGLFESELFGHCKGAFTGAENDRTGLIESANHGTLFLDEVGEMPLTAQVKLLRALQERRIRRVGDDREHDVDVRIVAATNRDLEAEVRKGHFREDLFFRLNVVPVHLPPLRLRREDIPLLARALIREWGEGRIRLTDACMQRLAQLPFMGNVRELENLLQRMLALSESDDLDVDLFDMADSTIGKAANAG